jgi:hypothetical protein
MIEERINRRGTVLSFQFVKHLVEDRSVFDKLHTKGVFKKGVGYAIFNVCSPNLWWLSNTHNQTFEVCFKNCTSTFTHVVYTVHILLHSTITQLQSSYTNTETDTDNLGFSLDNHHPFPCSLPICPEKESF